MLPISVCIIAKNEEKRIERCLKSLTPYGMEIVLVDTGSTDRTVEIASQYTQQIYHFEWCDDFSAARNYSLHMASYNWILMMDCDEWIEQLDVEELQYFMKNLPHAAGSVLRKNLVGEISSPSLTTDQTERFFSRKRFHYTGIIHEQLTPKFSKDFECFLLNSTILHDGYLMTEEERAQKAKRNLSMVEKQVAEFPDNPYYYYQLGKAYQLTEDEASALNAFGKGLEFDLDPSLAYVQSMVIEYGRLLLSAGQLDAALSFQNIYEEFATSADFVYLMGLIYKECQMYPEAVQEFMKATSFADCRTVGVNSYLAHFQIAGILILLGDTDIAIPYLQKCGDYAPALESLELLQENAAETPKDLRIFVATHVPCTPPQEDIFVPIHVGRAAKPSLGYLGDHTGDNISALNKYYSELTGLYWIWKNHHTSKYVGLCHYRRFFSASNGAPLRKEDYLQLLSTKDVIIALPSLEPGKTYYDVYSEAHNIADLCAVEAAIAKLYPDYLDTFQSVIHGDKIYIGNLFVTSKELFDRYAEWLFSVFAEASKHINPDVYDEYHRRVYGFLSEQLLFVWIRANNLTWHECRYGFSQEKAEVIQFKQQLFECIRQKDFASAHHLFADTLKRRPDVMLPASDITQTLPVLYDIIQIGLQNPQTIQIKENDTLEMLINRYKASKKGL